MVYKTSFILVSHITPAKRKGQRTPLEHGGTNSTSNFAIVCARCNLIKRTMKEATYRNLLSKLSLQEFETLASELRSGNFADKAARRVREQELI